MGLTVTGFVGQWREAMRLKKVAVIQGVTDAIRETETTIKNAGRANIRSAGLGTKFANALRVQSFPKAPKISARASVYVFSKIPYTGIYETGGSIPGSPLLWLPLPTIPKKIGRRRMTPKLFIQEIGRLRLVRPPGKKPLLVADIRQTGKQGGASASKFTAAALTRGIFRSKGKARTVPCFVGLTAVQVRKRISIGRVVQKAAGELGALIGANVKD